MKHCTWFLGMNFSAAAAVRFKFADAEEPALRRLLAGLGGSGAMNGLPGESRAQLDRATIPQRGRHSSSMWRVNRPSHRSAN